MKITFEGRDWAYDEDTVTVQQAVAMHFAYGLTLQDWIDGIPKMDPRSFQCCYWLMLQQNGEVMPIKECDFPLIEFVSAYVDAQKAEGLQADVEVPAEPAVPTIPSPPGAPASPGPVTPTATTPQPPVQVPVPAATVYGSPPS